jgi:hypothetical protein
MSVTAAGWKNLFMGSFLFLSIFVTVGESAGEKWHFIGFTRYRDPLYVDMDRIQVKNDGLHSVWTRITPAEHSLFRRQFRQDLQRVGKLPQAVKYLEMNKEIDCPGSRIRHIKLIYYDQRDRLITSKGNARAPWKPIVVGSLWPDLQKAVCGAKK